MKNPERIGFVGAGIMGTPMIKNLFCAGYPVAVWGRHPEKLSELSACGALVKDTLTDLAADCDCIITMLGYPADVESVYLGENGLLDSVSTGTYLIDMTTSSPQLAGRIEYAAKQKDVYALDAPVTGGEKGAENASLSIMVGGEYAAYEACHSILAALGKKVLYMGKAGNGQHTKLSNQIMIAGIISGVCEAMCYAQQHDLEMDDWYEIVSAGGASNRQLENIYPKIKRKNDLPGFKIEHFIKDMTLALENAGGAPETVPILAQTLKNYQMLAEQGLGEYGTQALIYKYLGRA